MIFTKLLVLKNERLRSSMLELRSIISFQNTGRIFRTGFFVAFLLTATGCTQIPEYANPIEWYKDTTAWITGENYNSPQVEKSQVNKAQKTAGFRPLASVPQRPKRPSKSDVKKMTTGLIADRASALYSDNKLRAQEESPPRPQVSRTSSQPISQERKAPRVKVLPDTNSRNEIETSKLGPNGILRKNGKNRVGPKNFEKSNAGLITKPLSDRPKIVSTSPPSKANILSRNGKPWGDGTIFAPADKFAPRFPARPTLGKSSRSVSGSLAEPNLGELPVAIVYFDNSSSVLTKQSQARIRKAFQLYKNTSMGPIHVVGHASSRTPNLGQSKHQMANFNISTKRANTVVNELIRLGVDPRSILISGMSDHLPAFLEVMPAGEAGNRRAEIYFNQ